MSRAYWPLVALLAILWIAGCDDRPQSSAKAGPRPNPTTAPVATQPSDDDAAAASTQPTTQQAFSELKIDGNSVRFPAARLRVSKSNDHVVARLYTDDPKAALKDDYQGNGFDLVMRLDTIREPNEIYMAAWQFKARSREYVESPYGIFLEGIKYQLQPFDVSAKFVGDMLLVRIELDGQFLQFDQSDPAAPAKTVYVKGRLLAPVEYKD